MLHLIAPTSLEKIVSLPQRQATTSRSKLTSPQLDSCSEILKVTFIKGTEPATSCTIHQKYFEIPKVEEYPEIKRPFFEEIEEIKKKNEEEPVKTEEKEEDTLLSIINKLKEKYKKQDE